MNAHVVLHLDSPSAVDAGGGGGLGADVDGLVTEMEALRQALDEADRAAPAS